MENQDPDLSNLDLEVVYEKLESVSLISQTLVTSAEMEAIEDDNTKTESNTGENVES